MTRTQAGADVDRAPRKDHRPVPMLADLIDAVIGVDTHRDTHHAELVLPTGAAIATCSISNDSAGYAQLLTWITDHAPAACGW